MLTGGAETFRRLDQLPPSVGIAVIDIFPGVFPIFIMRKRRCALTWRRMESQRGGADFCRLAFRGNLVLSMPLSSCSLAVRLESVSRVFKFKALLPGCILSRMRGVCRVSRQSSSSGLSLLSNIIDSSVMPLARVLCTRPRGWLTYCG